MGRYVQRLYWVLRDLVRLPYCDGMHQMFKALNRNHVIVNLDPANDVAYIPYECDIDIHSLVSVEKVMEEQQLGPNGALVFCMEYLLVNFDWLEAELQKKKGCYVVFDCPGQVELYSHYDVMKDLADKLQKIGYCLTCVHLTDSTLCTDAHKYISALLVSLSGQILMELPHINVFTKIDLLKNYAKELDFRLDYYAETQNLSQILLLMKTRKPDDTKFAALNAAICELVEDFNLVAFRPLEIQDKESVLTLLKEIDNANGYSLGSTEGDLSLFNVAISTVDCMEDKYKKWGTLHERYIDVEEDTVE